MALPARQLRSVAVLLTKTRPSVRLPGQPCGEPQRTRRGVIRAARIALPPGRGSNGAKSQEHLVAVHSRRASSRTNSPALPGRSSRRFASARAKMSAAGRSSGRKCEIGGGTSSTARTRVRAPTGTRRRQRAGSIGARCRRADEDWTVDDSQGLAIFRREHGRPTMASPHREEARNDCRRPRKASSRFVASARSNTEARTRPAMTHQSKITNRVLRRAPGADVGAPRTGH